MQLVYSFFDDFVSLLFPKLCAACSTSLYKGERLICTKCSYLLPFTNFHNSYDNPAAKQLWGRFPFKACTSLLYFKKGSKVQHMLHQLKYGNKPALGEFLGELLGNTLLKDDAFKTVDLIIPVPLHKSKQKLRGYNQSACIGMGVGKVMNKRVLLDVLIKEKTTGSQSLKSRYERYENLIEVFRVEAPHELKGKHVLLIDDVLTTGATVTACAYSLLDIEGLTLSIATVSVTENS